MPDGFYEEYPTLAWSAPLQGRSRGRKKTTAERKAERKRKEKERIKWRQLTVKQRLAMDTRKSPWVY